MILLCLIVIISAGIAVASSVAVRVSRLTSKSCSTLIKEMRYVDMVEICALARTAEDNSSRKSTSVKLSIERLGGCEGLLRLHHNAGAMMDIARYLILMNPDAYDLAQVIRHDALLVRRTAKSLYWKHRLHLESADGSAVLRVFARRYVSVTVQSMTLYTQLVDEVLPLIQEVSNVQAQMGRALVSFT